MGRKSRARTRVVRVRRRGEWLLYAVALAAGWLLSACGGASTEDAAAAPAVANSPDVAIAQQVYAGTPRTPADFYTEPMPVGVTGPVATVHLKNSDVTPAANGPRFELCTDDTGQAISWSEMRPSFNGSYADIVDMSSNDQRIEIIRVPRSDSTARLQHRVFRCSYLDRSTTDLDAPSGQAGTVNSLPLDTAALKRISEYLWRFTIHNNADHVVLASEARAAPAGRIAHAIEMARLTRAATAGACDTIDILRWTHTADTATGALQRELSDIRSFQARRDNLGTVTLCP
ncbi:MAG: hypothetical protein R3E65_09015 [Steroidobacteraceae bacterium]